MLKHLLLILTLGLTLGEGSVTADTVDLPQMGDTSGAIISPEQEKELGEAFMRELRRALKLIDDPESQEYLQALGYRLASNADYSSDFTFFIVDDGTINAFAAPGGYIGIHTGLVLASQSESELASVLAHEIAHITQRHLPRAFEQASQMSLPMAAALIAAIVLGQNVAHVTEAAIATTLAGAQQSSINFTRANEKEADNIGMQLLAASHFDPRGMPDFFGRLQQNFRYYDSKLPEFLSSHPVTTTRIAESRSRAEQYPMNSESGDSFYRFFQAKTRVASTTNNNDTLAYFKAGYNRGTATEQEVARYGYALALLKTKQLKEAHIEAQKLLRSKPEKTAFILLTAAIENEQGHYAEAISLLENALLLYPHHHPLTLLYGETLINAGQADKARKLILQQMRYRKADPQLYKLYAHAAEAAGFTADSHEALAEYYYLIGELATAVRQLELASSLNQQKDFYLQSRLDARLNQFRAELAIIAPSRRPSHDKFR